MYDHELDQRIDRIARRQAGAFNLEQLRSAGGDDDVAAHRIAIGRWVRLAPSVLAVVSFAGTFERQCWAAVLGEPEAYVGGWAAAHQLGFGGFRPCQPEIVVPPGGNARSELAIVHRYEGAATTRLRGLPITTPAQTLFDIAPKTALDRLERVLDGHLLRSKLSIEELDDRLAAYAGTRRAGLPVMRLLIGERRASAVGPPVSELERRGDRILRRLSGRPIIVAEASFPWLQRGAGRVDRFLPDDGVIVEFDGRLWHARLQDFETDRWRDNEAVAHGLVVLRFTWAHITLRPAQVLALIEQTRRSRRQRRAA